MAGPVTHRVGEPGVEGVDAPAAGWAVELYRRLAEANPGAYLPDLAMSLNNLGNRLSEMERRQEAAVAVQAIVDTLDAGPRAELRLALRPWLTDGSYQPAQVALLALAAAEADAEQHPQHGARARRAVRAAIATGDATTALAQQGVPAWATTDIPDEIADLINEAIGAPSWAQAAKLLRAPESPCLVHPQRTAGTLRPHRPLQ